MKVGGLLFQGFSHYSCCASLLDRLPTSGSDPEANHLDRLDASLQGLAFCRRNAGVHETGDHVAIEPMDAHKQRFGGAMWVAGKESQQL
jgi:hypothetical protein